MMCQACSSHAVLPAGLYSCKLNYKMTATGQSYAFFATLLKQQCVSGAKAPGQSKNSVAQAMYAQLSWSCFTQHCQLAPESAVLPKLLQLSPTR